MKFNFEVLFLAVKEPLREALLAALPVLLAYFGAIEAYWAAVVYLILRFIDSYLHTAAKEESIKTRNEGLLGVKGLTGF